MSKQTEALKLALEALNRNDYLGWQTNIHVRQAIREALAEQPAQGCDYCNHPQYAGTKCKNCGREQPAQQQQDYWQEEARRYAQNAEFWRGKYEAAIAQHQEPVAWRNAALRVGEDLCSVGPFGYYDMTAEQWLDWALSVVTVHAPPASKPWVGLTDEEVTSVWHENEPSPHLFARAIEAKLREKNT